MMGKARNIEEQARLHLAKLRINIEGPNSAELNAWRKHAQEHKAMLAKRAEPQQFATVQKEWRRLNAAVYASAMSPNIDGADVFTVKSPPYYDEYSLDTMEASTSSPRIKSGNGELLQEALPADDVDVRAADVEEDSDSDSDFSPDPELNAALKEIRLREGHRLTDWEILNARLRAKYSSLVDDPELRARERVDTAWRIRRAERATLEQREAELAQNARRAKRAEFLARVRKSICNWVFCCSKKDDFNLEESGDL